MRKFSLYMKEEELRLLDDARDKLSNEMGVPISRNSYIRSLLFGLMKKDIEIAPEAPTNPLQIRNEPLESTV